MGSSQELSRKRYAWIVLLTRPSYLPGVVILAHSLQVHSCYPLVVAVTPSLPEYAVDVLMEVGAKIKRIQPLLPKEKVNIVAERFQDTWTKLVPFGFDEYEVHVIVDIFSIQLIVSSESRSS